MRQGWIAADVAAEFPELRLHQADVTVPGGIGRSDEGVRERLSRMSNAFRGAGAIAMRTQPIHHAHRVFFRHIGLDPDRTRPPAEAIAVERLERGHFKPVDALEDALVIAIMETGVPIWALEAGELDGELGIRAAAPGEAVAGLPVPPGRLVVADASAPVAVLFGDVGPRAGRRSVTIRLFAVQVAGVPGIHVEEAMWTVEELLSAGE